LVSGYLQLAGGTNNHTVDALEREGLFLTPHEGKATIAGVAYGGYARKVSFRVAGRVWFLTRKFAMPTCIRFAQE